MPSQSSDSTTTLQADVVFIPDKVTRLHQQEGQQLSLPVGTMNEEGNANASAHNNNNNATVRNFYRPLFITLYCMLVLAVAGLAFSVTRYVQLKKNARPAAATATTTTTTESDSDSDSASSSPPKTLSDVDPNRDPVSYRSDIEFILSTELDDQEISTKNFLEGAQKRAIDWLVYDDFVLTSAQIRTMAESLSSSSSSSSLVSETGSTTGSSPAITLFPLVQRYALMVLFFEANGELWSSKPPWTEMVGVHECKFTGIECDSEGRVTVVDLGYRKLRGRLPDEVGMLSKLTAVNLMGNNLEGTIPSFVYNKLTNLGSLMLSSNEFHSTISSDISKLTNLKKLYLGELFLTGQFPVDAMKSLSSLEHLAVSDATEVSGPLLEYSSHWPNLTYFDIYESMFTGTIPTTIGTNSKLQVLLLEGNAMDTAALPTELGLLTNLEQLSIDSTQSMGEQLPTELGNCRSMRWMMFSEYGGSMPTELGELSNLQHLTMVNGMATGTIPSEIGRLTNLVYLSVFNNRFEGTLPTELGNLGGGGGASNSNSKLQFLNLYKNNFSGTIPSGLCDGGRPMQIDRDCGLACDCCSKLCNRGG